MQLKHRLGIGVGDGRSVFQFSAEENFIFWSKFSLSSVIYRVCFSMLKRPETVANHSLHLVLRLTMCMDLFLLPTSSNRMVLN